MDRERCYVAAFDARTGKELWHTYTAPGPGEPGGDTWGGLPVDQRVSSPWGQPGSYDPVRNRVYWGFANPTPFTRIARHNGNVDAVPRSSPSELYSNSTVAMNPESGRIEWYHQHNPGDDWDFDYVQENLLVRSVVTPNPQAVKWINPRIPTGEQDLVVTLGEGGGLVALERETGRFLWETPFPFDVPQFHLSKVDVETGRTYLNWDLVAKKDGERHVACYSNTKSFFAMAYHPLKNSLYIPYNDVCIDQTANVKSLPSGAGPRNYIIRPGADPAAQAGIARVNVATGVVQRLHTQSVLSEGSVLPTAGEVVFWGDLSGRFHAFDAETGKLLWQTTIGGSVNSSTITYSVNGRQYVAVLAGNSGVTSALLRLFPERDRPVKRNAIYVFSLPDP
jgi:alcohol dehydrogenase (cytochrome c)